LQRERPYCKRHYKSCPAPHECVIALTASLSLTQYRVNDRRADVILIEVVRLNHESTALTPFRSPRSSGGQRHLRGVVQRCMWACVLSAVYTRLGGDRQAHVMSSRPSEKGGRGLGERNAITPDTEACPPCARGPRGISPRYRAALPALRIAVRADAAPLALGRARRRPGTEGVAVEGPADRHGAALRRDVGLARQRATLILPPVWEAIHTNEFAHAV